MSYSVITTQQGATKHNNVVSNNKNKNFYYEPSQSVAWSYIGCRVLFMFVCGCTDCERYVACHIKDA